MTTLDTDTRYRVDSYPGVAWRALGWVETVDPDDEDQEPYVAEGEVMVRVVMVGDDRVHTVDVDALTPIGDDEYCSGCGQIGCGW